MNDQPLLSILMPVRDGLPALRGAVASMLHQQWSEFEMIAIDDGSRDGSGEWLDGLAETDARVRVVHLKEHRGLPAALNHGARMAVGPLLARMDADDISHPDRIFSELQLLADRPDVGVCGTWVRTFGDERSPETWRYPSDDADIRATLLFECCLAHPSIVMRRAVLEDPSRPYDESLSQAEDYDLWARLLDRTKFANVPHVLLDYRCYPGKLGATDGIERVRAAALVRRRLLSSMLDLEPTPAEARVHEALSRWHLDSSREFVLAAESWLRRLLDANQRGLISREALERVAMTRWLAVCRAAGGHGPWTVARFERSPITRLVGCTAQERLRLYAACGVRAAARWELHSRELLHRRGVN